VAVLLGLSDARLVGDPRLVLTPQTPQDLAQAGQAFPSS
jgi:hypothetical protein